MSIKRRLENQYQNFVYAIRTITLPAWLDNISIKIGLVAFILLFSVLYLLQISTISTTGYTIHDLEKKVNNLSAEIQKNNIAVAEASAMPSIQKRLSNVNMVAVQEIRFVAPVAGSMALR